MNHKKTGEKGISIIYAMLVSSVVLAVGTAVASIAAREVTLSSFSRESQAAYFAADAGINCALWYDLKAPGLLLGAFSTSTADGQFVESPARTMSCNGQTFNVGGTVSSDVSGTNYSITPQPSTFTLCFNDSAGTTMGAPFQPSYSAVVTVSKAEVDDPVVNDSDAPPTGCGVVNGGCDNYIETMIESRGYNSCDPTYVRRVERAIRVTY